MHLAYTSRFPACMVTYFQARWDKRQIWQLDLPVHRVPTASLEWHLDYPFWSTNPPEPLFDLRPRTVLGHPADHPAHYQRILAADTTHPIELGTFGSSSVILDGIHRLARLVCQGARDVRVRYVPHEHIRRGA